MGSQGFLELMDAPGNIVHGSFLDNLETIMDYGICPPALLPAHAKPKRFFGNTQKHETKLGTNMPYISTMLLGDENHYSFERFNLWSPFFHYFIVADHQDWGSPDGGLEAKRLRKPYFYRSTELALYFQTIPTAEFLGFVTYPDYLIAELAADPHGGEVFRKDDGSLFSAGEINGSLIASLEKQGIEKPIYDINGERLR